MFKDEKKIIELLLKKKDHSSWTKNLVKESGLTKVKLSRTLRKLEEKNLIEKMPYGNENLIKLKKWLFHLISEIIYKEFFLEYFRRLTYRKL